MRPILLNPLFVAVSSLKGIGPASAKLFERLFDREGGPLLRDLLLHLPLRAVDRRLRSGIAACQEGETVTVAVTIDKHRPAPPGRGKAPHRTYAHDATGDLVMVWFGGVKARIEAMAPVGEERIVSGTIQLFDGMRQMVHPDHVLTREAATKIPPFEPVYPATEGLSGGLIRRTIAQALERLPVLPEWHERETLVELGLPPFGEALRAIHLPHDQNSLGPEAKPWQRIAYDELLAHQLALSLTRRDLRRPKGVRTVSHGHARRQIIENLPFSLTGSQNEAVSAILGDMAGDNRMVRLLQGDVGSGKTVVALLAMAEAAEAGRQAALMAPTELLARQHAERLRELAAPARLAVGLLTGREKAREREDVLRGLADGSLSIVVGTHALIQEQVHFKNLGLAIVDEQHRFGVRQRQALVDKGRDTDLLLMTATPIPRSLVLSYFGETDTSNLREKPAGRKPVDTRLVAQARLDEVIGGVGRALDSGQQIYWVCPLVEESETSDATAAQDRYAALTSRFGQAVALIHGQMAAAERDSAMERFRSGEVRLLVATTVIEVGVDVPNASIMVIEQAERFGLAQLHQLRGRIGRGSQSSTCILLFGEKMGEIAKQRLKIMKETEDGFVIAEADLELRGEGDVLGLQQSGMPSFHAARMPLHRPLLDAARTQANLILQADPALKSQRGEALRHLLHLFDRADALMLVSRQDS